MSIAAQYPARPVPVFLTLGFRPFFLAAGVWAAAALAVWIGVLTAGTELPSRFDPLSWHIHEMFFGFAMAAVAGFLLTAIPNWTKRPPVDGLLLAALAGLWLLGRVACLISALFPAWLAIVADLSFPAALVAVVAREIIVGGSWRNLPIVAPVAMLGAANLLMHLQAAGVLAAEGLGWRLGLAAAIALISVVAGRIVPSFTRNWLGQRGGTRLPKSGGWVDRAALGTLHAGLFGWAADPELHVVGMLLLVAAAFNLARLFKWRGGAALAEPLLFILHVGYFWLVLGTALLGLASLDLASVGLAVPQSAAIHALTAGAIGTMILAVMTRATRGHTGRELAADPATGAMYLLVSVAAILRVAAAFSDARTMLLLVASAVLWIAAFGLFVAWYGPMLILPKHPARPPGRGA